MTQIDVRFNMSIVARLELAGWQMTSAGPRYDYWHKRNWTCQMPHNINLPVRFWRSGVQQ